MARYPQSVLVSEEMPLRLLSPYQSFTEAEYQACKQILHQKYPDWVQREL